MDHIRCLKLRSGSEAATTASWTSLSLPPNLTHPVRCLPSSLSSIMPLSHSPEWTRKSKWSRTKWTRQGQQHRILHVSRCKRMAEISYTSTGTSMYHDVKRRLPYYWRDIRDAFTYRVFASTVRMYFVRLVATFQESQIKEDMIVRASLKVFKGMNSGVWHAREQWATSPPSYGMLEHFRRHCENSMSSYSSQALYSHPVSYC